MNDRVGTLDTIADQIRKQTDNPNLTDKEINTILIVDKARRRRVGREDRTQMLYINSLVERGYDIEIRSFLNQWHIVVAHDGCSASVVDKHLYDGVRTALDLIESAAIENEP